MKPKTLALMAVAIGCGLVAMLGVQQAMQGGKSGSDVPMRKVLVVVKDVKPGIVIKETDVAFQQRPETSLQKDAITKLEQYRDRAAKVALTSGDVVNESKLLPLGVKGKSIEIPKGARVITVSTDSKQSHSGMLAPGDRVDIQVTFKGRGGFSKTVTLLEFVQVFATENRTQSTDRPDAKHEDQKINTISLLLDAEQANFVKLAESKGKLSFMLRNPEDDELVNSKAIDSGLLAELTHGLSGDVPSYEMATEIPTGIDLDAPPVATTPPPATEPATEPATPAAAPPSTAPEFAVVPPFVDTVAAPVTPPPPANVQDFLGAAATLPQPPAAAVTPPVAAASEPKVWSVQIRNGKQVTTTNFEIKEKEKSAVTTILGKLLPTSKD